MHAQAALLVCGNPEKRAVCNMLTFEERALQIDTVLTRCGLAQAATEQINNSAVHP
jgi:hypothetical protein